MAGSEPTHAAARPSVLMRAVAALAFLIALVMAWQSADLFRQGLVFTAAETEVSFWGRADYTPSKQSREQVSSALQDLLQREPGHPVYLTLAASYYDWQAFWAEEAELEYDYTRRAEQARMNAQRSRPAHPGNKVLSEK